MGTNGKLGLWARLGGLILLFLLSRASYARSSSWQITSVAVSPDGRVIALVASKRSTSFIYTVAVDTGVATRLTDANDGEETSPTFSPDGKRIAYSYEPGNHTRSRIVIVNVDGSGKHEWSPSSMTDLSPVLSPDNQTIVFARADFYGSHSPIAQPHPHGWSFFCRRLGWDKRTPADDRAFLYGIAARSLPRRQEYGRRNGGSRNGSADCDLLDNLSGPFLAHLSASRSGRNKSQASYFCLPKLPA